MFHGPVTALAPAVASEKLRQFLPGVILNINWERADLFTTLKGCHFLPVDKNVYLQLQRFISSTEDMFPQIKYTTCTFKDHLMWSSLTQDDVRILYKMLVCHLTDDQADLPPFMQNIWARFHSPKNRFICGPGIEGVQPLEIYLGSGVECTKYQLVIYQLQGLICLFVIKEDANGKLPDGWAQMLDQHLSRSAAETFLTTAVAEHYQRKSSFDEQFKYIYFNHMNLALKTSLKSKGQELNKATLITLANMHEEFETSPEGICEVLVRTHNDRWIVGRKSEQREFYIIFDNMKNSNLMEINEEVKKLSKDYFQSIFITE